MGQRLAGPGGDHAARTAFEQHHAGIELDAA
jgi:hypothetical protein